MSTGLVFDRSRSPNAQSLAADRYRADSTTINSYFWLGRLADGGLNSAVRVLEGSDDPMSALTLPEVFQGRLPHDVASLRDRLPTHTRWRRLLTLVMIASALERYMDAIARLAVASDPLLMPGFPKVIDGAALQKRNASLPARDLTRLTVGEWSRRIAAYRSLFGAVPAPLEAAQGDLEFIRKSRNRVAHALGVADNYSDQDGASDETVLSIILASRRPALVERVTVSDERLLKLMGAAQRVVVAVDHHLMTEFIGAYELLALYQDWISNPDDFEDRAGIVIRDHKRSEHDRFQNVLGELFGNTKGTRYVKSLEEASKVL